MTEVDPYPISALQDRYKLGKQAVYDRINKLGIQPIERGKISGEQLSLLDKLDSSIEAGETIDDFVNSEAVLRGALAPVSNPKTAPQVEQDSVSSLTQLARVIALALKPQANPLQHLECLERAASSGWLLSTKEVKHLLQVKPHGEIFNRGSFAFVRSGKIGGQTAWRVEKIKPATASPPDTSTAPTSPHTSNPLVSSPVGH